MAIARQWILLAAEISCGVLLLRPSLPATAPTRPILAAGIGLVPLTDSSAVAVVDLATNSVVKHIATRPHPQDVVIAPSAGEAYVLEMGDREPEHTIAVVALNTLAITRRIDLAPYRRPHWAQLSRDGHTMWVACSPDSAVIEVDLRHGRVARVWRVDGGSPWMFVVTPDESKLVVTQFDAAKATVISRATGAHRIVPLSGKPMGAAASPDGTEVWIAVTGTDSLYVLSTASDSIIARFASAGHEPARIAFTPDGGRAVITASRSDVVMIYDRRLRTALSSIPTGTGSWPKGLVLSADGTTAWVSLMSAGRFITIDLPSTRTTNSVTTGGSPERSAVTARHWGPMRISDTSPHRAIVSMSLSGSRASATGWCPGKRRRGPGGASIADAPPAPSARASTSVLSEQAV